MRVTWLFARHEGTSERIFQVLESLPCKNPFSAKALAFTQKSEYQFDVAICPSHDDRSSDSHKNNSYEYRNFTFSEFTLGNKNVKVCTNNKSVRTACFYVKGKHHGHQLYRRWDRHTPHSRKSSFRTKRLLFLWLFLRHLPSHKNPNISSTSQYVQVTTTGVAIHTKITATSTKIHFFQVHARKQECDSVYQ